MSTSQALMALLSTDLRAAGQGPGARAAPSADSNGEFAGLLAEQLPAQLESALEQLSPEQLAALEQAALAADGKMLPAELQDLLQLPADDTAEPVAEDALAVIGQWMQWLQEAADPATSRSAATAQTGEPAALVAARTPSAGESAALAMGGVQPGEEIEGELPGRELAGRGPQGREPVSVDSARQASASSVLQQNTQQTAQQNSQQEFAAALQRASGSDSTPSSPAMLGKLVEQLESLGRREDGDTLDSLDRPGAQVAGSAAALTARPVAAAAQAMGVPFGQPSWGEAMVERVMWMSSQNLRSVEIQLDPAELGPLEIHIQHRGQELQVQFVSQNPSVREALEAQMYRLRDMFGQQGLEQAQVSVADRSPGEQPQSRQGDGQLAERGAGRAGSGGGLSTGGDGEVVESAGVISQSLPLRRLVDYYV